MSHVSHADARERIARLDESELDLLKRVAAGAYDREIAHELEVSPRTVKRRVATLVESLGVDRRIQAVYLAGVAGLLDGEWLAE